MSTVGVPVTALASNVVASMSSFDRAGEDAGE
jgi:hypothetical protein